MDNKNFEDISVHIVAENVGNFSRSVVVVDGKSQYLVFKSLFSDEIAIHKLQNYKNDEELLSLQIHDRLCTVRNYYGDVSNEQLISEFIKYALERWNQNGFGER